MKDEMTTLEAYKEARERLIKNFPKDRATLAYLEKLIKKREEAGG